MYQEFEDSRNIVSDKVDRYQCHELNDKPVMNQCYDFSSCKSLKFLGQHSFYAENGISIAITVTPNQYSIRLLTLNQALIDNIIIYDREVLGGIHMFSQRNLGVGCGLDVIYDLQNFEIELAWQLHMELIQVSPHILGDIRDLIPQEQIPLEQAELLISPAELLCSFQPNIVNTSLDNPSKILSFYFVLLNGHLVAMILQDEKLREIYQYICEPSLHLWLPAISELENLDESFPDSLFVNQTFEAYKFVMDQIE
ncbi:e3 ubiquitin-protein ligase [Gigaspora margarita]|uniref:E3 ubiquitin-protein ligase n=1 Tax=Gigaspora margarita TaxID=4874 RepID=A0A8H3X397_GIGMA|nr:e3 ubiquitin-protein ligase [Gigaspora margarita]